MKISKTIQLKKGQVLQIDTIVFPIEKDCEMIMTGKDISDSYGSDTSSMYGNLMVSDYHIECEAIDIVDIKDGQTVYEYRDGLRVERDPVHLVRTYTDIGGHVVSIKDKNGNCNVVAFHHNGFGDGNYRLKFKL